MAAPRTRLVRAALVGWGLLTWARPAAGEPGIGVDRLGVSRGLVLASCTLTDAFDSSTRSSIARGLPITVRYTVDLWRDRRNWMDKQIDSRVRSYRVRYHPGERLFSVTDGDRDDRRQTFETLEQALEEVSRRELPVHPRWELDDSHVYFVTAEVAIQPLTWSEFQELDGWISGRIRGEDESEASAPVEAPPAEARGVSRAVFEFLVDLSGFGDTYLRTRTAAFRPADLLPFDSSPPASAPPFGR